MGQLVSVNDTAAFSHSIYSFAACLHDFTTLLADTFGDSLKFVNRLYNKRFGYTARKVIAHMPHFLDRDVLFDLAVSVHATVLKGVWVEPCRLVNCSLSPEPFTL
jgi:hypothetical protein